MRWVLAQKVIDWIRGKRLVTRIKARAYPFIYLPLYNIDTKIDSCEPEIYNNSGFRMRSFFLRDIQWAHSPSHLHSKYFLWDRYNFGLTTHFYSHGAMLQQYGCPKTRYGIMWESEAVVPYDYKIFEKHKSLWQDFQYIFTFSETLLETIPNARFFPACASPWYGKPIGGGSLSQSAYTMKCHNVSIVSSEKCETIQHQFRLELARKLEKYEGVSCFGTYNGGELVNINDSLQNYRFSFAIENDIKPLFFTERITNCFAAMTIPIYSGASRIGEFFNLDGIILLKSSDIDNIDSILLQCTEEEYYRRLSAVIDNYYRVQKYLNVNDWLYLNYLNGI